MFETKSLPEMLDDVAQASICRLRILQAYKFGDLLQRQSFLITKPNEQPVGAGQLGKCRRDDLVCFAQGH